MTNILNIFHLFSDKDLVQKIVDEKNHCAEQLKSSRDTIFSNGSMSK